MTGNDLVVVDGAAAGAWIEPRLGGEFGAVPFPSKFSRSSRDRFVDWDHLGPAYRRAVFDEDKLSSDGTFAARGAHKASLSRSQKNEAEVHL